QLAGDLRPHWHDSRPKRLGRGRRHLVHCRSRPHRVAPPPFSVQPEAVMSRLARFRSLLAILLAVGVLGACSRNSEPRNGPEVGEMRDARVDVSNFNWLDMAIYAVRGGMRVRLGTVTSMNRERFTIPPNLMITD